MSARIADRISPSAVPSPSGAPADPEVDPADAGAEAPVQADYQPATPPSRPPVALSGALAEPAVSPLPPPPDASALFGLSSANPRGPTFDELLESGVVTKQTRLANGWNQTYYEAGPKDGPLVMVLHGYPGTPAFSARMIPELVKAGYHVVAPELRWLTPAAASSSGSPATSSSIGGDIRNIANAVRTGETQYGLDTIARDVEGLAATFSSKPMKLVTHDFGSLIGYQIDPKKVESLVTMAIPHPATTLPTQPQRVSVAGVRIPLPLPALEVAWRARHFAEIPAHYDPSYVVDHVDTLVDRIAGGFRPDLTEFKERLKDPALPVAIRQLYSDYDANALATTARTAVGLGGLRMYGPSSVPTLAIAGQRDGGTSVGAFEDARRYQKGPYEVKVVDAGHFIAEEADVAPSIVDFLQRHRRPE